MMCCSVIQDARGESPFQLYGLDYGNNTSRQDREVCIGGVYLLVHALGLSIMTGIPQGCCCRVLGDDSLIEELS